MRLAKSVVIGASLLGFAMATAHAADQQSQSPWYKRWYQQSSILAPDKAQAFKVLDADSDGLLSRAEASSSPELTSAFDQADANRSGRLSRNEFAQLAVTPAYGADHEELPMGG